MWIACLVPALGLFERRRDATLVDRALRGDAPSRADLAARLLPRVRARVAWTLARHRGGRAPQGEIDDYAHEVWVALLNDGGRHLRSFDPDRGGSLEGYVSAVTRREVENRLRAEGGQRRGGGRDHVALEDEGPTVGVTPGHEEAIMASDLADELHRAIDRELPERGRLVFRYVFADGRDADDVARLLGVDRQVVYNWVFRCRTLAARVLAEGEA